MENLRKKNCIVKKSNFKFQKWCYLSKKNIPKISWNFGHNYFIERWFSIFRQKISKTFLSRQKSNFTSKIGGILGKKKFRKCFETSVISSLERADSRYFGQKFQKPFKVDKNPTEILKIAGILAKKNISQIFSNLGHK